MFPIFSLNELKKIVIVTSGQPSANPRAVKEALLLANFNFSVTFIYCEISSWADVFDKDLISKNRNIQWIKVGCHSIKQPLLFKLVRLRAKFFKGIYKIFRNNVNVCIKASVLFAQELERETKRHKAELYIAHNLGALQAAYLGAKKFNGKLGFDAEDFHRGEFNEIETQYQRTKTIENKYFPLVNYCTVASPLIGAAYGEIFSKSKFTIINNVFSKKFAQKVNVNNQTDSLNLFWFSQHIGTNRGLENVILAINICKSLNINLHLLGNVKPEFKTILKVLIHDESKLIFHHPVSLENIFEIASQFEVGLASEECLNKNKEYALSNKIFTYLLAGNCILYSNTPAQALFHSQNPETGFIYKVDDCEQLSKILIELFNNREALNQMRKNAFEVGIKKFNWEIEGQFFLSFVNNTLQIV